MEEKLVLNDGTELAGHVLETNGVLFVYLYDKTLAEGYPLLSVPEKTRVIVATRYGQEKTYTGYNHLYCIKEEYGGMLSAGLQKVT